MSVTLGVDIGTGKVAAAIWDNANRTLIEAAGRAHGADLPTTGNGVSEQSMKAILDAVDALVAELDPTALRNVEAIGVTGQMHSVTLWNDCEMSPLISWRDRRASAEGALEELVEKSGYPLRDGFGGTSLAMLARAGALAPWRFAATAQDYLVYRLCALAEPVTDATDAASWGLFDLSRGAWRFDAAKALNIPERLLPKVLPVGAQAGTLSAEWAKRWGVPVGVPVSAAIGDNQASILGVGRDFAREIFLTLGTGAQLSLVLQPEAARRFKDSPAIEPRPFLDGARLAVAAPLCGGGAFAWLKNAVQSWQADFQTAPLDDDAVFARLDALALAFLREKTSTLRVVPSFLGERHAPEIRGEIRGIDLENFTLGHLMAALAEGVARNLRDLFPPDAFAGRDRLIASGNGLRKLAVAREMTQRVFGLPLQLDDGREEAARGAAILATRNLR